MTVITVINVTYNTDVTCVNNIENNVAIETF